jgi:hypothetical protein
LRAFSKPQGVDQVKERPGYRLAEASRRNPTLQVCDLNMLDRWIASAFKAAALIDAHSL